MSGVRPVVPDRHVPEVDDDLRFEVVVEAGHSTAALSRRAEDDDDDAAPPSPRSYTLPLGPPPPTSAGGGHGRRRWNAGESLLGPRLPRSASLELLDSALAGNRNSAVRDESSEDERIAEEFARSFSRVSSGLGREDMASLGLAPRREIPRTPPLVTQVPQTVTSTPSSYTSVRSPEKLDFVWRHQHEASGVSPPVRSDPAFDATGNTKMQEIMRVIDVQSREASPKRGLKYPSSRSSPSAIENDLVAQLAREREQFRLEAEEANAELRRQLENNKTLSDQLQRTAFLLEQAKLDGVNLEEALAIEKHLQYEGADAADAHSFCKEKINQLLYDNESLKAGVSPGSGSRLVDKLRRYEAVPEQPAYRGFETARFFEGGSPPLPTSRPSTGVSRSSQVGAETTLGDVDYVALGSEMDRALRVLTDKKGRLTSELQRIPLSGGTAATRRKKDELDSELDTVEREINGLRMRMRRLNLL
ncbi:hypothetical protein HK405_009805 [Cladochytrium tenue]|nr:hypothetical protein HK405_009805 [Cladochytrium tenue]